MSTLQKTEFHVPEDGILVLPVEFRGKRITVQKKQSLPKDNTPENNPFFRKMTLEEIDAEQGGPKVCTDPDKLFGYLSDLWESPEDVEEFLRRRKEEP